MGLLATTTRGLEPVAIEETATLTGADARRHHPGMLSVAAPPATAPTLQRYARTLNRVLVVVGRTTFEGLEGLSRAVRAVDLPAYLQPDQPFAVRATRHGEHPFTSPDIERVAGQAVVDEFHERTGEAPPVDLDDPTVILRLFVRHERVVIAVDATGQYSLHRRAYRTREHEAPLRPTTAAAMVHLAGPDAGDRVVDPCCGCGTIPIETALLAAGTPVRPTVDPALSDRHFPDADTDPPANGIPSTLDVVARDHDPAAVGATRENAASAGVSAAVAVTKRDVTTDPVDADVLVTDLPYGIRTGSAQLPALYEGFAETVSATDPDRLVVLTANPDLLPYEPTETYTVRRGNLEATLLVVDSPGST
ncbi:MAG: THUMP domain-containing protein [Halovenus sp.]